MDITCDSIEDFFPCIASTNVYITPENSVGFGKHFDDHDVFILQISGKKNWELYESLCPIPLNNKLFNEDAVNKSKKMETYELEPGDLLYIPRGVIHNPYTKDNHSVHATISINTIKWKDLAINMIKKLAHNDDFFFRSTIPIDAFKTGSNIGFEKLTSIINIFKNKKEIHKSINSLFGDLESKKSFDANGMLKDLVSSPKINQDTEVYIKSSRVYFEIKKEEINVFYNGNKLVLPVEFKKELEWMLEQNKFKVSDFFDQLSSNGKIFFIQKMIVEGFLAISTLNVS